MVKNEPFYRLSAKAHEIRCLLPVREVLLRAWAPSDSILAWFHRLVALSLAAQMDNLVFENKTSCSAPERGFPWDKMSSFSTQCWLDWLGTFTKEVSLIVIFPSRTSPQSQVSHPDLGFVIRAKTICPWSRLCAFQAVGVLMVQDSLINLMRSTWGGSISFWGLLRKKVLPTHVGTLMLSEWR